MDFIERNREQVLKMKRGEKMYCDNENCLECLKDKVHELKELFCGLEHFTENEIDDLKENTKLLIKHFPFSIPDLEVTVKFDENNNLIVFDKLEGEKREGYLCDILDDGTSPAVYDVVVLK